MTAYAHLSLVCSSVEPVSQQVKIQAIEEAI